jgi:hypothetical protein
MLTWRSAVSASIEFPAPARSLSVLAAWQLHQFPEVDTLDSSELPAVLFPELTTAGLRVPWPSGLAVRSSRLPPASARGDRARTSTALAKLRAGAPFARTTPL